MNVRLMAVAPVLAVTVGVAAAMAQPAAATTSTAPNPWIAKSGLPRAAALALQARIDAQLAAFGGTQVSSYEIAYNAGDPIMVFANPLTGQLPTSRQDRVESAPATSSSGALTTAVEPLTSYRYGCPYTATSGWDCFYQNINFNDDSCSGSGTCGDGGRMLEFQDCGTQSLATYGFADQTSSWVNNTSVDVDVYDDGGAPLWSEAPGGASANVGSLDNDRAASFWIVC